MNFEYPNKEAVHIKVKKYEADLEAEYRKFSVDPHITSYNVLRCLLSRAFDIRGNFTVSYMAIDDIGEETYLPLLSDWDLDAAFISASDPCLSLHLHVTCMSTSPCSLSAPAALSSPELCPPAATAAHNSAATKVRHNDDEGIDLTQLRKPSADLQVTTSVRSLNLGGVINQMQNTFTMMSRVLTASDEPAGDHVSLVAPSALSDGQFHDYLDAVGRLVRPKDLRVAVYRAGVEPSLRKVVWKHLLNVYPEGMTARERVEYVRLKSTEYRRLRDCWMLGFNNANTSKGSSAAGISGAASSAAMVKKDVLRTDRHVSFYGGRDDNANVVALFNLLTTYAVHHPSVGYVQGMSDLASPLLYVMRDEAHAYICFCGLMQRLRSNFTIDGVAMTTKFEHLAAALRHYDPELFHYLRQRQADDLLFCYRWLLLELKREFVFESAVNVLEVLWASLQPSSPCRQRGLPLAETPHVSSCSSHHTSPHTRHHKPRHHGVTRHASSPAVIDLAQFDLLTSTGHRAGRTDTHSGGWLPSPQHLAGGNPFLVFVCISLLQQQRTAILSRQLDYQEVGMLFDRLVRRQDATRTLRQARHAFAHYLKHHCANTTTTTTTTTSQTSDVADNKSSRADIV